MAFSARGIELRDLPLIMKWRMDPEITKWMNTDPVLTLEGQKKWLQSISDDETCRYWLLEVEGESAGVLSLVAIDLEGKTADWGYYIGEKRLRSMRFAISVELSLYAYCFEVLGLTIVRNSPHDDNFGAIKLHKLCGNQIVGIRERAVRKNGIWCNLVDMEITKDLWMTRNYTNYEKIDLT